MYRLYLFNDCCKVFSQKEFFLPRCRVMLHHKLKFTANAVGSLKFGFVIKTIKEEEEEVKVRVNFSDFKFSGSLFSCLGDVSHCSMSVFRRFNTTVGSWYGDLKGTPDLAAGKLEA